MSWNGHKVTSMASVVFRRVRLCRTGQYGDSYDGRLACTPITRPAWGG
jgi:hypothetical protein